VADREYWLDLFSPETWNEIEQIGYETTGFNPSRKIHAEKVPVGAWFLCYLTGKSRFVGILEALSESYWDETQIWRSDTYPVRFRTRLICRVPEDRGLHYHDVLARSAHERSWTGYIRGSPVELPRDDGEFIAASLEAIQARVARLPPEPTVEIEVGGDDEGESPEQSTPEAPARAHDRIQHRLLALGRTLGYQLWVATNDRSRTFEGERFGDMAVDELPIRFDGKTRRTIERIDVLWLAQNRIEAAFEIESTTSIYSGLLRMADLLAMQPNIDVPLFIVAPSERRNAVFREIRRPVFSNLPTPSADACQFIAFERLEDELNALGDKVRYLRKDFVEELAERAH
jgi:hypothetical protein